HRHRRARYHLRPHQPGVRRAPAGPPDGEGLTMAFIELRQLSKIFGPNPRQALAAVRAGMSNEALLEKTRHTLGLKDVTLSIERGEIFVVMGLSGSGKSTLIRHINRLIDPTDGAVEIDGVDVLGLSIPALTRFRRETMSMVFQRFGLF